MNVFSGNNNITNKRGNQQEINIDKHIKEMREEYEIDEYVSTVDET